MIARLALLWCPVYPLQKSVTKQIWSQSMYKPWSYVQAKKLPIDRQIVSVLYVYST